MIVMKQLRFGSAQPRATQPHRQAHVKRSAQFPSSYISQWRHT